MSTATSNALEDLYLLELVNKHYKPIFRFVRSKIGNEYDADEITNDCFLAISRYRKEIKDYEAFLFKTAKNRVISFYRKTCGTIKGKEERNMASLDDENNAIVRKLSFTEEFYGDEKNDHFETQREIFNVCVTKFPEWEQQIVEFKKEGLSKSQIAKRLNMSEEKIDKAINRINMRLRSQVRKLYKTAVT